MSTAKFDQGLVTQKMSFILFFCWNVNARGGVFPKNSSRQNSQLACLYKQVSVKVSSVSSVCIFRTHIKAVQEQKQYHRIDDRFAIGFE